MIGRKALLLFALAAASACAAYCPDAAAQGAPEAGIDVRPRPLPQVPAGTVLGDRPPAGWSHLLLFAKPRLGRGDVKSVGAAGQRYASMFCLTLLADVRGRREGGAVRYSLARVGAGFALNMSGRYVVTTSKQTSLGLIGQSVFRENEKCLREVLQVARTPTLSVFDAKAIVLRNGKHVDMVIRHVVVVSPDTGRLSTLVGLLAPARGGNYAAAEDALQLLRPGLKEDRVLNVKGDKIGTLGIPERDAFALVRIPQGTPVKYTPALKAAATPARFSPDAARRLEAELFRALRDVRPNP